MELYAAPHINPNQREKMTRLLEGLNGIIAVDPDIARKAGEFLGKYRKEHSLNPIDTLIAATALNIDAVLATRNKEDLIDALGDPYPVVMKTSQKSPLPLTRESKGKVYEILCETENGQVLFIVGRLFPDGNLYIITAYWAGIELAQLYRQESEVLRNE